MTVTADVFAGLQREREAAHTDVPVHLARDRGGRPPKDLKVVVTMPAYHAGRTLERTLADLPAEVAEHVILVDDASTDDTVEVARRLGLTVFAHDSNKGYGGNQKTCYTRALEVGADVVVMLHPDYQYNPRAVPLLIAPILSGDADMTFGSRFAGMSDPRAGGMPWYRYVGNRVTTTIQNQFLGTRFTELHSGLRAYSRACLLSLPFLSYSDGFDFDAQFLCDAIGGGLHVIEVPIPTRYTTESSSIAVGPSLHYVARSVQESARARLRFGRRGEKAALRRGEEPTSRRVAGPAPTGATEPAPIAGTNGETLLCPACGPTGHDLEIPANASRPPAPGDFASTAATPGIHDDVVRCRNCGVTRSESGLTTHELIEMYEQCVDTGYLEEEPARREAFSRILDHIDGFPTGGKRLLDVGAHIGLMCSEAASRGWDATGVEPSRWAVTVGRERFGVDLRQDALESFAPDGGFDVVTLLDVVEHLHDPVAGLAHVRTMLADRGLVAMTTVDAASLHARIRGTSWPWFFRPHLWHYTPASLRRHLDQAGFRAVEWRRAPVRFTAGYALTRGADYVGPIGRALTPIAATTDRTIPLDWLGDSVLVIARAR